MTFLSLPFPFFFVVVGAAIDSAYLHLGIQPYAYYGKKRQSMLDFLKMLMSLFCYDSKRLTLLLECTCKTHSQFIDRITIEGSGISNDGTNIALYSSLTYSIRLIETAQFQLVYWTLY